MTIQLNSTSTGKQYEVSVLAFEKIADLFAFDPKNWS